MSANNTMTATAVVTVIRDSEGAPKLRVYSPTGYPEAKKYSGWFMQIKDSETDKRVAQFLVKTTSKEVADALTKSDGQASVLVGYLRNENLAGKNADGTPKTADWKPVFNVTEVR